MCETQFELLCVFYLALTQSEWVCLWVYAIVSLFDHISSQSTNVPYSPKGRLMGDAL